MPPELYINAYKNFIIHELELTAKYAGSEYANRMKDYYNGMYSYILNHPEEFVVFKKSGIRFHELEFAETVEPIRERLMQLATEFDVPIEILFLPRVNLGNGTWDNMINSKVINLLRKLYDDSPEADFEVMRRYQPMHRTHKLVFWTETAIGKNVVSALAKELACDKKSLLVKQLKLFDGEFVRQQQMWLSREIWVHKRVIEYYNNQK